MAKKRIKSRRRSTKKNVKKRKFPVVSFILAALIIAFSIYYGLSYLFSQTDKKESDLFTQLDIPEDAGKNTTMKEDQVRQLLKDLESNDWENLSAIEKDMFELLKHHVNPEFPEEDKNVYRLLRAPQTIKITLLFRLLKENNEDILVYEGIAKTYLNQAIFFSDRDLESRALFYFVKVYEIDSSREDILRIIAWLQLNQGHYEKALGSFLKLNEISENHENLVGLGWAHYGTGKFDNALVTFGRSLVSKDSEKSIFDLNPALAWSYYNTGQYEKAINHFTKSEPKDIDILGLSLSEYMLDTSEEFIFPEQLSNYTGSGRFNSLNSEVVNCIKDHFTINFCLTDNPEFGIRVKLPKLI